MKPVDCLLALIVPLTWGMGLTVAKFGLGQFPPILLMAFRFTVAALVLVWFVKPPWPLMRRIFVITLISATIQYSLTYTGLEGLDVSTAVILIQLESPFLALCGVLFLGERMGLQRVLGMVLAFSGIVLMVGEPTLRDNMGPVFLVVSGTITWAVGQIMIRRMGAVGGITLIAWVAVFASPQLFIASFLFEDGQVEAITQAGWLDWGVVLYLGLIMTALGYAIWYHLLGRCEITSLAPFLLLLPLVTVSGGILILGEEPTTLIIAGGAVVLAGVVVMTFRLRPKTGPG